MEECRVEIKRIIAALDLSSYSEITFSHALTLARALGAELILLNVINDRGLEVLNALGAEGYGLSKEKYVETVRTDREAEFRRDYLSRVGEVPTRLVFRVGLPYEQVLKAIEKEQADMVVIGAKGRSNLAGVLFGTTAEKVIRRATCTVVSVRGPEHCRLPE